MPTASLDPHREADAAPAGDRVVDGVARRRRPWLAGFAALNAVAAWGGAIGLLTGSTDFGDAVNQRLPFDSVVVAGLALASIVAVPLTVLAWSAWTAGPRTDDLCLLVGVLLVGWILGQIAVIRAFSPFQPAYLAIGLGFVATSHRIVLRSRQRAAALVALGSLVAALGAGLLPHPIDNGLTAWSVVAVVLVVAGLALVGRGAIGLVRGRGRLGGAGVAAMVVVVLAVTVWIVAPPVAGTVVPASEVTATPAAHGLAFESVTVTTSDGVDLAGWYLPGTDGAAVVVAHGAGSTRSDVLDQAAVLVRHGYAALLLDARGHGDSGGTAMDFGWYGDADLLAGVELLASRPEVDADRIGVVGLSMGGEEAIGAAAADPRIRAVVAEGATGRSAADKGWLSDEYGWRGWLQEQVEQVQYGIVDYLAEPSPPTPLRRAVAEAPGTEFLLITAGEVRDEALAAASIRAGAPDRVAVWEVEGAGHTGGLDARPEEWSERVLEFLDAQLG